MGMSNMQVQQPMQQSSGKGMGGMPPQGGSQSASFGNQLPTKQFMGRQPGGNIFLNTPTYFDKNPDVARSFQQNNYGMNEQQFADTHFQKYGQAEGRATPSQYSNTVSMWDNASIMPKQQTGFEMAQTRFPQTTGKAGKNGGFEMAQTRFPQTTGTSQPAPKPAPAYLGPTTGFNDG